MIRNTALMSLIALLPACGSSDLPQNKYAGNADQNPDLPPPERDRELPAGDYFGAVDKSPDPTHLRWCNHGEPDTLDPALTISTVGIPLVDSLWAGLAELNKAGLPYLHLATSMKASPDKRRFQFELRKNARWSNGRPLTARDFVYHAARVLHPLTASRNAEKLWPLKNGELYTQNRVRLVLRDTGPFHKGDIVELIGRDGRVAKDPSTLLLPDPNTRTSQLPLNLRDLGADESDAYYTVPAGGVVTIIDLHGPDDGWAYVFYGDAARDGIYGWVPANELAGQPNGDVVYTVREVPPAHVPNMTRPPGFEAARDRGNVRGKDILMVPEVLGIRAVDDDTLVVETWRPVHDMKNIAADGVFRPSPRNAVSRWPSEWSRPEHIVTSGPLHLAAWKIGDEMVMVKSDTYWDQDVVKTEKITVVATADQTASVNLYKTGQCDAVAANNIPSSFLPALNGKARGGKPYADFRTAPFFGIYFYMINVDRFPNVHFRRALSLAVDRTALPRILRGDQIPATQFVPGSPIAELYPAERTLCGVSKDQPGVALVVEEDKLCYVPPRGLGFDPEAAKKELAIAREQMGGNLPASFTVTFNAGLDGHKLIAEYLQNEWKEVLGLDVSLASEEWRTFLKSTAAGDYDVARMGWIGTQPLVEDFIELGKCDSPHNRSNFCDPDFERLFARARRESDRSKRLASLRKAERILLHKAAVIPLYVYTQSTLQKPYVRDLAINMFDRPGLFRAWIDPDWEQHASDAEGTD